jgi:Tol biopolymer transport system component
METKQENIFMKKLLFVMLPVLLLTTACLSTLLGPAPTPTLFLTYTPIHSNTPTATRTSTPTKTFTPTTTLTPTETPPPVGQLLLYQSELNGSSQLSMLDLDFGTRYQLTNGSGNTSSPGWTPDGMRIIYHTRSGSDSEIHIVNWDGTNDVKLAGGSQGQEDDPVISPDGSMIAYFATHTGSWALYVMDPAGNNQHPITANTVFNSVASWSPDSKMLVFTPYHNTESPSFVASVNADGSGYKELTRSSESDGEPVWSPDGSRIAFDCYVNGMNQICSMKADGSDRQTLTHQPGGNTGLAWSPDGKQIAFTSWRDSAAPNSCDDGNCNFEIYVMNADGSKQTRLTNDPAEDWNPAWSPDGSRIAFISLRNETRKPSDCGDACNSEIYVMNADGSRVTRQTNNTTPDWNPHWRPQLSLVSQALAVPTITPTPLAAITAGGRGQLTYWAQVGSPVNIYLVDLNGTAKDAQVLAQGEAPSWSPDGNQIAYVTYPSGGGGEITILDISSGQSRKLTQSTDNNEWEPAWSPDGKLIAFSRDHQEIDVINADGTNEQRLFSGKETYYAPGWSPDGTRLVFLKGSGDFGASLMTANRDGSGMREVAADADWSSPGDWSPDGRWIAYGCSQQGGQVCLIRPDGSSEKVLTRESTNGSPSWSPNGQWIAFNSYRDGAWQVYIMKADGSDQRRVTSDWNQDFQPRWRP